MGAASVSCFLITRGETLSLSDQTNNGSGRAEALSCSGTPEDPQLETCRGFVLQ